VPRAGRLNVLDLLITFPGGREPRLNANRAICAVPLPPFMRINSEFIFELTIARQSCAPLILPSANANLFPFFERTGEFDLAARPPPARRLLIY
jgi:hypothetical protein